MATESLVFANTSARAGCDTGSILKLSLTGLNSGFFFFSLRPVTTPRF